MIVFNLNATTQKSYYGKAQVLVDEPSKTKYLKSYNTIVAKIDDNNQLHKLWNGYSRTTQNHIKDFCKLFNISFSGSKKDWLALKNESNTSTGLYKVEFSNYFVNWTSEVIFDNYDDADNFGDKVCKERNNIWYNVVEV